MRPASRMLGAVLAGGRSSRFGSDKAVATMAGVRLLDRAVDTLREACGDVVVVSSNEAHEVPGAERIPDLRPGVGPLAGIEAALRRAREEGRDGVLVLACDLPGVDADVVRKVVAGLGNARAAAPARDGDPGFEPLCAAYRTSCLEEASRLLDEGRRSVHHLLEAVDGTVLPAIPGAFLNVNTPSDLEEAQARHGFAARRERTLSSRPTVVCVVGKKKSGKTTTVVGLVAELASRGHEVMTVKHGHGFEFDREGSDSWKHRHLGGASRVVMAGPDDFAVVGGWGGRDGGEEQPLEVLVDRYLSDADIVIAEGFKTSTAPRIEVFRRVAHGEPVYGSEHGGKPSAYLAILTDDPTLAAECPVLDVDDPERFARLADLVERLRSRKERTVGS